MKILKVIDDPITAFDLKDSRLFAGPVRDLKDLWNYRFNLDKHGINFTTIKVETSVMNEQEELMFIVGYSLYTEKEYMTYQTVPDTRDSVYDEVVNTLLTEYIPFDDEDEMEEN